VRRLIQRSATELRLVEHVREGYAVHVGWTAVSAWGSGGGGGIAEFGFGVDERDGHCFDEELDGPGGDAEEEGCWEEFAGGAGADEGDGGELWVGWGEEDVEGDGGVEKDV